MPDQFQEAEDYFKQAEQNLTQSFGFIWRMIYRGALFIGGLLVPLVNFFMPKKEENDDSEIF